MTANSHGVTCVLVFFNVLICVVGQYRFFYDSGLRVYAKNCCNSDTVFVIKVASSGLVSCLAVETKLKLKD